ncbi:FtsW/RodA/SpoVE family cell cycle protein [Salinicoccus hispanicus]|uniref:FtsW/RodA/SpoVE family cell cycle protein n=1 Tax=Salinicoccus hispanicus TaxID=157225 RepID=A0A6N8U3V0_9STAP|nr:FtsW/RodA/SpoVE family cell cycle protein [Salinicoccus hispanicus]MXQ51125.1 FtsW/RodA/SpoVE family cell cycle protein [Salinicoccus hispanicus]
MENNQSYKRQNTSIFFRIDWILILLVVLLGAISIFMIRSAMTSGQYTTDFSIRQLIFYGLGFVMVAVLNFIPIKWIKQYVWVIYSLGVLSLVILFIAPVSPITPIINGAKSWYQFGFFSIQPSEIVKIIYIITLAYLISQHNKYKLTNDLSVDIKLLFKIFAVSILPMLFILLQNDLGTTLVMIAILLGTIVVSGISWWLIIPTLAIALTVGGALVLGIIYRPDLLERYLGIHPYQFERIYSWLRPEEYVADGGFQLSNSLKAIGSGGVDGKGFADGIVYIPENHTDFIFTIIGEEFGFIGTTMIIVLLFMLLLHLFRIAMVVPDSFSSYFIIGYLSMLTFHIFQNIGMTIQLVPITGIPLPFISYGGSGLWANMMAVGIIMSIYYHQYNQKA